jgi:hypothetical protein
MFCVYFLAGMYDSNGQWNVAMSHVQNDPMLGGAADPTTINSPHQTEGSSSNNSNK